VNTWSSQATTQNPVRTTPDNLERVRIRIRKRTSNTGRRTLRRYAARGAIALGVLLIAGVVWVTLRGVEAKSELQAIVPLAKQVETDLATGNAGAANLTLATIGEHADKATSLTSDPVWKAYELVPVAGTNLRALSQVSTTMSALVAQSRAPFSRIAATLTVAKLLPSDGRIDLAPLTEAQPSIAAAHSAVTTALAGIRSIDTSGALPQVAAGVGQVRTVLASTATAMDAVNRAALLAPAMLGADGPRNYLLVFQNNAELRASGGIPGALALVHTESGKLTLTRQASGASFGEATKPVLALPANVRSIYTDRVSTFMQDVTLTPDFPTSASLASALWQKRFHQKIDGVISLDPVALSYLLQATGPLHLSTGATLTAADLVPTVLSKAYATYQTPDAQDAYFRAVAAAAFQALSSGSYAPQSLLAGLTAASAQHRLLIWNAAPAEQSLLADTTLAGTLQADSKAATHLGVYFNDNTGAKMDFYLRTGVVASQGTCTPNGSRYTESVTLTSDAPSNAAKVLPALVTGGGHFGVKPGLIKTRVFVYGPQEGTVQSASDGAGSGTDGGRPVVFFDVLLKPGATSTVSVSFEAPHALTRTTSTALTPTVVPTTLRTGAFDCAATS
jgi:hypothetical protein